MKTPVSCFFSAVAVIFFIGTFSAAGLSQEEAKVPHVNTNKFRQLGQELPTPNVYRTASGAPGYAYWQQQVDYNIDVTLDGNLEAFLYQIFCPLALNVALVYLVL